MFCCDDIRGLESEWAPSSRGEEEAASYTSEVGALRIHNMAVPIPRPRGGSVLTASYCAHPQTLAADSEHQAWWSLCSRRRPRRGVLAIWERFALPRGLLSLECGICGGVRGVVWSSFWFVCFVVLIDLKGS